VGAGAPGRRSRARTGIGRTVHPSPAEGHGLHLLGTLTAAAPHQHARGRSGPGLLLHRDDLRRAVREGRESNLVLFAVDASGSMAARARMSAVSGAVLSLLRDAYQRRDRVGLVTFRGAGAEVVLPPTSAVDAAAVRLRSLRTGGRTPLAEGLLRCARVLATERLRDPARRPLLLVLTDGRATHGGFDTALAAAGLLRRDRVPSVVVDCESGPVRLGLSGRLWRSCPPMRWPAWCSPPAARRENEGDQPCRRVNRTPFPRTGSPPASGAPARCSWCTAGT
jgi:magnesium chelatase subunit D